MSGLLPALSKIDEHPLLCPVCGHTVSASAVTCPVCGGTLSPTTTPVSPTLCLKPVALNLPPVWHTTQTFDRCASLILQFQPTGICVSLALPQAMTLGRGSPTNFTTFLDLTDLDAVQHGVSRHHVQLRREGSRLMVRDLGSTNGTFLNEQRLVAHRDYAVRHGEHLRLGSLNVILAFSDVD